jgi:hypothetical protein
MVAVVHAIDIPVRAEMKAVRLVEDAAAPTIENPAPPVENHKGMRTAVERVEVVVGVYRQGDDIDERRLQRRRGP